MKYKGLLINTLVIIFGDLLLAAGIGVFILPFNIDNGGVSGISVILQKWFDPVLVITLLSWGLFLIGWVFLKEKFAIKTLFSATLYPLFLNLFYRSPLPNMVVNDINDPFLAAVLGSILVGVGLGLVYRVGGTTGGVDVISMLLYKYKGVKLSVSTFIVDILIVLAGMLTVSVGSALYGIVCVVLTSYLIEKVTVMGDSCFMMHIISKEYDAINEYIIKGLSRTCTILDVKGGYDKTEKKMIEVVFNDKEYYKIKYNIEKIDKEAFISIYKAINVYGKGFNTLVKK